MSLRLVLGDVSRFTGWLGGGGPARSGKMPRDCSVRGRLSILVRVFCANLRSLSKTFSRGLAGGEGVVACGGGDGAGGRVAGVRDAVFGGRLERFFVELEVGGRVDRELFEGGRVVRELLEGGRVDLELLDEGGRGVGGRIVAGGGGDACRRALEGAWSSGMGAEFR